ncbi:hypothetical protein [Paenibacillus herberti]|uniref:Uncharacterized protein n=1 Tax=Paenibacillus herberti TaxID=1619309 RepID=A0A229P4Q8_9BACL|nr:hypothetical protein [Paenibacillus herberti]OXM17080.1 hypothetical protein CGZ75_10770 [Paenibacillus herberti]
MDYSSVILILFILLVIFTCTFSKGTGGGIDEPDDDSSTILITKGYEIFNGTNNIRLNVTSISGEIGDPPSSSIIFPGGVIRFVMTATRNVTRKYVTFDARNAGDVRIKVGELDTVFECHIGSDPVIRVTRNTAPIATSDILVDGHSTRVLILIDK